MESGRSSSSSAFTDFVSNPAFVTVGIVAAVIGVARLVWAIAGVFFRKPGVRSEFTKNPTSSTTWLGCSFFNDQLRGWFFVFLHILRHDVREFSILGCVCDADDTPMVGLDAHLHDRHGAAGVTLPLPASIYGLECGLVGHDGEDAFVIDAGGTRNLLVPGTYSIHLILEMDEKVQTIARRFLVGATHDVFDWVGDPYPVPKPGD
jgi:hypothetical protein